jgi:putative oxidoreductase
LPGKGLLIVRLAVSAFLIRGSFEALTVVTGFPRAMPPIVAAGAGLLLLAGLWTPVAGLLVALLELCIAFSGPADPWPFLLAAAIGAALALLGPGAWSADARIYGRKRIAIRDQ